MQGTLFGNNQSLRGRELERANLQIDEQAPLNDVEELIFVGELVPVVFALHDSPPPPGSTFMESDHAPDAPRGQAFNPRKTGLRPRAA